MMRSLLIPFVLGLLVFVTTSSDVYAQSGSRGGSRLAPRASYGIPSRVGGSRSKTIQSRGRPTGMMNSANAARMSGGGRGSGSGSRPTTGISSPRFTGGGAGGYSPSRSGSSPATGIVRPSRRSPRASTSPSGTSLGGRTVPTSVPDGFRVWTDATGKYSIQGKLAGRRDGMVWIRRMDGKLARLNVVQLSSRDQQFLSIDGA